VLAVSVAALVAGAVGYAVIAWTERDASPASAREAVAEAGRWAGTDRIVFRSTAAGEGYGHVATVPLADPGADRTMSGEICDRVDATTELLSCLRTVRGIVPTFTATVSGTDGEVVADWPLPGIPSRTRISPDGALIATTSFVTGHSYATVGFSTATTLHRADGQSFGNLEEWTLLRDGERIVAADRNFWGITFADSRSFYATVGMNSSGTTWLVRGDIPSRTLETLAGNVECPSLSPDGTRIAFKRVTGSSATGAHWTPSIYDVATGEVRELPEPRSIDDQIEWLDDESILYGMPRVGEPGDSDVWLLAADGRTEPAMLIEHAWSPSVVGEGSAEG